MSNPIHYDINNDNNENKENNNRYQSENIIIDELEPLNPVLDIDNKLKFADETKLHAGLFATQMLKSTNSNADHLLRGCWSYCFIIWFILINVGIFTFMMIYFTSIACPTGAVIISPQWGSSAKKSVKISKSSSVDTIATLYPLEQGYHVCSSYVQNSFGQYVIPCLIGGMNNCYKYSKHKSCPQAVQILFDDDDNGNKATPNGNFISSCLHTQKIFNTCIQNITNNNITNSTNGDEDYYYSTGTDDKPLCQPFACSSYSQVSVGFIKCFPAEAAFSLAS